MDDGDSRSSILNPRPFERARVAAEIFLSSLPTKFFRTLKIVENPKEEHHEDRAII
jgi:hypothetical protein